MLCICDGVADHDVRNTGNRNDITSDSFFSRLTLEANGSQQFRYLDILGVFVAFIIIVNPCNLLTLLNFAGVDAQQRDTAEEVRRVQVRNVCLQRRVHCCGWLRQNVVDNIEKRLQRVTRWDVCVTRVFSRSNARATRSVEHRKIKKLLRSCSCFWVFKARSNLKQQVLRIGDNFFNTSIRAVSLVHRNDHWKFRLKCFSQHEAGLRKWAFRGIDKQHDAINHGQPALNLATEVSVTRGVNNVDDQISAVLALALAVNRSILGQNGDAALALLVVGVHDAVRVVAVFAECAGLFQHAVDEGGFAVVNVGDDGYITELSGGH